MCQINLGELDPSTHPNFVLKLTRAGRSDLYWTLDHARSLQRVARTPDRSHSRLHFAHSTRTISAEGCAWTHSRLHFAHSTCTISAEGCAGMGQIALSPAFRALDTHDLRRGYAHTGQIAFAPAFRALDTHDLRRGLRACRTNRTLACISRTRHARSPQRVARTPDKSHSRLRFAHSTRTISAEGCARTGPIALSPACRALDTHDLRRGVHFRLTLFVPPSAFKREFVKWGNVFH